MGKHKRIIRVRRLSDHHLADRGPDRDMADTTPAERMGMMWQLALDAWAFMGAPVHEPRLPRHVIRVNKRRR